MTPASPRSLIPGRPLLWLPRPSERGSYPRTCLGERPAALLPEESEAEAREIEREAWMGEIAAARAYAADLEQAVALLVSDSVAREQERGEQVADSLDALSTLYASDLSASQAALDRLMGAALLCEARALKGDPKGAALMLCRWLKRMRESGGRGKVGAVNETARDVQPSGPGQT